jgi:hypothetical protein
MWSIRVEIQKGKDPLVLADKIIHRVYPEIQSKLAEMAEYSKSRMIDIITSGKKRPDKFSGVKLEDVIDVEYLNTTAGVDIGVGNIMKLNSLTPYWQVLNSGCLAGTNVKYIPNYGNWVAGGSFSDNDGRPDASHFREGQWDAHGATGAGLGIPSYTFKAKKTIEGLDYITLTAQEVRSQLEEAIQKAIANYQASF